VSRLICLVLTLAMVGCAQHVTPLAPTSLQPSMPNAGATAANPADSATAYVTFHNRVDDKTEFTVYWSYAADPIWHVEAHKCLQPGDVWHTQVVYNHIKRGPQIRFEAAAFSQYHRLCAFPEHIRTVTFHKINFTPDAHFDVRLRHYLGGLELCAHGGGNKEVCDLR
jgi:hypothetical protein